LILAIPLSSCAPSLDTPAGSGQIDAEVARQDWRLFAADAATVFDLAADKMWPELSRQSEFEWTERLRREDLIVTVSNNESFPVQPTLCGCFRNLSRVCSFSSVSPDLDNGEGGCVFVVHCVTGNRGRMISGLAYAGTSGTLLTLAAMSELSRCVGKYPMSALSPMV
jgi:hypothetical protein